MFGALAFLEIAYNDSLEHFLTLVEVKPMKKNWGTPNWVQNWDFSHFLEVASLVFLDIAQDSGLKTISNTQHSWNLQINFVAQILAEIIFLF